MFDVVNISKPPLLTKKLHDTHLGLDLKGSLKIIILMVIPTHYGIATNVISERYKKNTTYRQKNEWGSALHENWTSFREINM